MSRPFICASCRVHRLLSKQVLSGRKSTRTISQSTYHQQDITSRDNARTLFDGHGRQNSSPCSRDRTAQGDQLNTRDDARTRGRYSARELRPEDLLDQLDTLSGPTSRYATAPNARSHSNDTPTRAPRGPSPEKAELYTRFGNVITCIAAKDTDRAWSTLVEIRDRHAHVLHHATIPLGLRRKLTPSILKLSRDLTTRWLASMKSSSNANESTIPAPFEIFELLYNTGLWRQDNWPAMLWQLSIGLHELQHAGASPAAIASSIEQLMSLWKLCIHTRLDFHKRRTTPLVQGSDDFFEKSKRLDIQAIKRSDWSFLPPATLFTTSQERRSHAMFEEMLARLIPAYLPARPNARQIDYASGALVTLDALRTICSVPKSGGTICPSAEIPKYAPFVVLLETILKHCPAPRTPPTLRNLLVKKTDDVEWLSRMKAMATRLNLFDPPDAQNTTEILSENVVAGAGLVSTDINNQESDQTDEQNTFANDLQINEITDNPEIARFTSTSIARLGRALERQDMHTLEKIKREIFAFAGSRGSTALPLVLYEHLMLTLLSLRNPTAAIEVWNSIVAAGYEMTAKTYTVMIRGAQASRDFTGMETFWQKMRQASVQPDEHAWSSRIHGHIWLKRVKSGLQALNDMGNEWFAAAKAAYVREQSQSQRSRQPSPNILPSELLARYTGSVDGVVRPNLVVVNSAISALASKNDSEIPKVLSWGRSFGIEPDLTTFNALLNVAMRHGNAEQALQLLQRMRAQGIEADSTTWTVLLTAVFNSGILDDLSHTEQQERIMQLIKSMQDNEESTSAIDQKGYALIIDRLLKHHGNPDAAAAVLAYMRERGCEPTAYIYTILISFYFQRKPQPDFAAIEALWGQISSQDAGFGARLDSVFYDRMIEGYATHHGSIGLRPALGFLARMQQEGKKPSWRALECLSRALAEKGEWDRLRTLVDNTRISLRNARGGTLHMGQRDFWNFIISIGLMKDEGVVRAEDIMAKEARPMRTPLLMAQ